MSIRRFATTLSAVFTALALTVLISGMGVSNVAQASPGVVGAPHEGAKVTLWGETTVDSPAIVYGYPLTWLAWTGTDSAHHLNLMSSTDGLHYGNKHVLPETSPWSPAVANIGSAKTDEGNLVVAWAGTDGAHTLNLAFIHTTGTDISVTSKYTFWGETTVAAPSVASINGDVNSDVYVAWIGSDGAHTLNVLHQNTLPPVTHSKQTFWGWNSNVRPSIIHDSSPSTTIALILSWTAKDGHLSFANTSDRTHWTMPAASPLSAQSAWGPSMLTLFATDPTKMPTYWLAWTGSGSTSSTAINVQYTQLYPTWSEPNTSVTLVETAFHSPALAYNGNGGPPNQILVAWAGTDGAHTLNVAFVAV